MDRRRFAPSTEPLDSRLLLSGSTRPTSVPAANLQQKTLRIERLPAYLESLQPGRILPMATVTALQDDVRAIVGKLSRPPGDTLVAINEQFRTVISHASLSAQDAKVLSLAFTNVLEGAGTSPDVVARFRQHMSDLASYDTNGREPAILAANDYALISQTVLAIGRPIRTPPAPTLSSADDSKPSGDHKTTVTRPHLIGRYDTDTTIQLVDSNGTVLGAAPVAANGEYSVQPSSPLAPGKYRLSVRAFDPNGDFSAASKPYVLAILPPKPVKPGGPLAL